MKRDACAIAARALPGLGTAALHLRPPDMAAKHRDVSRMRQRTSQLLFQYWNDVRGERLAPERFDIEPARIAAILPETCILERDEKGGCLFRLAGTRICDNYGWELRGHSLADLVSADDRQKLGDVMSEVTERGAAGLVDLTATASDGREVVLEALLLPLLHMSGTITRYLGSISPVDPPAWLGAEKLTPARLASHALVWPDGRPHAVIASGNRQAPFVQSLAAARVVRVDRRQFRVVQGGRADHDVFTLRK